MSFPIWPLAGDWGSLEIEAVLSAASCGSRNLENLAAERYSGVSFSLIMTIPDPLTSVFRQVAQHHHEVTRPLQTTSRSWQLKMKWPSHVLHVASSVSSSSLLPIPFEHHAIVDLDRSEVIHFARDDGKRCVVKSEPLKKYKEDFGGWRMVSVASPENADRVLQRARSKVGKDDYNIMTNNCEHFANWCMEGRFNSVQVNDTFGKVYEGAEVVVDLCLSTNLAGGTAAAGFTGTPAVGTAAAGGTGAAAGTAGTAAGSTAAAGGTGAAAGGTGAAAGPTGTAAGGTAAAGIALLCVAVAVGMSYMWIQWAKGRVQSRQSITVENVSQVPITVTLKTVAYFEAFHNSVHWFRSKVGVGKIRAEIPPGGMDELFPPCEDWFEDFILIVTQIQPL